MTSLSLRKVVGKVENTDEWLKKRLTIDVASDEEIGEVLDSPDSPFADPAASTLKNAPPDKALNILALQWGDAEIQEFARRVSTAAGLISKV